ncbi:MAG TPA: hypothetical protein VFA07_01765 [Chthonomonadaceae bacterium]|nr:hypothetical protein [Chthonomonadaceae bacterium]
MFDPCIRKIGRVAFLLSLGLLAGSAGTARADIIPELSTVASLSKGQFLYTYQADLTNDEVVQNGNYFTIYDFNGFVPGSNDQPADWIFSSANVGVTPSRVTPHDNPRILNLTWTYSGSTQVGPGPVSLGQFSAVSADTLMHRGDFAAEATKYVAGGTGNGTPVDNIGKTGVPGVPESNAAYLLVAGLTPLGLLYRKRSAR